MTSSLSIISRNKEGLPFAKNEHGHYSLTIVGRNLTGKQEVGRLKERGFQISDHAHEVLISTHSDSYDQNHRLVRGKLYGIVLVQGCEVRGKCTKGNIQDYARSFGYEIPLAGVIPRIRETVSDKEMEQMNIWHIAALHDPVIDHDGDPSILLANRDGKGRWLGVDRSSFGPLWGASGAFVFLVPAN